MTNTDTGYVGGLVGIAGFMTEDGNSSTATNCFSLSTVSGADADHAYRLWSNAYSYDSSHITACYYSTEDNTAHKVTDNDDLSSSSVAGRTRAQLQAMIPDYASRATATAQTFALPRMASVDPVLASVVNTVSAGLMFQVGISSNESSQLSLDSSFEIAGLDVLRNIGLDNRVYLQEIDEILSNIMEKQTEFGAMSNRLESVLDEISIKYENLVSSRSTIRDADIAEVSSTYIQQQILQQASATLLATANQSPAIALQLI